MVEVQKTINFYPFYIQDIRQNVTGSGVYMIRNVLNQKCYIGSSANLSRRLRDHLNCLNKQTHQNKHLQAAYNKYGQKSFEFAILEQCENIVDTLVAIEQKYLDLKPEYNNAPYANTNLGCKRSASQRKKMSEIRIGKAKPLINYHEYKNASSIKFVNKLKPERFVPVNQLDLDGNFIAEYESISQAGRAINRNHKDIGAVCRGKQISAFGFKWEYKNKQL